MPVDALRIAFATPAYWPALAYGGPVRKTRALAGALAARGHDVRVYTSGLGELDAATTWRTRPDVVDRVPVRYLATPARVRWVGLTPTAGRWLNSDYGKAPPDVLHVFGFRDAVGLLAARWARRHGVPYVFEPLGMYSGKLRKLRTKRLFDATVGRRLARDAAAVIATSELERRELLEQGLDPGVIVVRPNGFPDPAEPAVQRGDVRARLGIPADHPLVVYVGRVSAGKGLEYLAGSLASLPEAHLVVMGPDSRDGTSAALERSAAAAGRIHLLSADTVEARDLYGAADLLVLPSAYESFGNAAAEAAAAGLPSVVTDRCGVAELLAGRAALVVPFEPEAITEGIRRLLVDGDLHLQLGAAGPQIARELSWSAVAERQEEVYRAVRGRVDTLGRP
jgi:glycosyltransferase involved in cell wall biosynthesis